MIGTDLKKIAGELQFNQSDGIAYGILDNYLVTLSEDSGIKTIAFSTFVPNDETAESLKASFPEDMLKQYHIQAVEVYNNHVLIRLAANSSTIRECLNWLASYLTGMDQQGLSCCPQCGNTLSEVGSTTMLVDGIAIRMHTACGDKLIADAVDADAAYGERQSNYGKGFLGALIGAVVSAIPWAIVYALGYFVGWLGFLIGFAAKKGYDIAKGKVTKFTLVILTVTIVVGVVLGQILGIMFSLLFDPEFGIPFEDLGFTMDLLFSDSEFVGIFIQDFALGMVFAALSCFGIFKETFSGSKPQQKRIIELK